MDLLNSILLYLVKHKKVDDKVKGMIKEYILTDESTNPLNRDLESFESYIQVQDYLPPFKVTFNWKDNLYTGFIKGFYINSKDNYSEVLSRGLLGGIEWYPLSCMVDLVEPKS